MANWWKAQYDLISTDLGAFLLQGDPIAIVFLLVVLLFGYLTASGSFGNISGIADAPAPMTACGVPAAWRLAYGVYAKTWFSVQAVACTEITSFLYTPSDHDPPSSKFGLNHPRIEHVPKRVSTCPIFIIGWSFR